MYWYVKALLVALALVVVGTGVALFWNRLPKPSLPSRDPDRRAASVEPAAADPADRTPAATAIPAELARAIMQAREKLRADDPLAARNLIEEAMQVQQPERFSEGWNQAAAVLSEANTLLIGGTVPSERMISYTVQRGDNLWVIARNLGVTVEQLRRNSGLPPESDNIRPGQTLRVYQANWRIETYIDEHRLLLFDGDRLVKVYPIGIGRQGRTPEGAFTIGVRQTEPVWQPPGRVVPFGHPDNPLGTRWLQLVPTGDKTSPDLQGYGIHGTSDETSIGRAESNGCIRMHRVDVEELYDLILPGVKVVIKQ